MSAPAIRAHANCDDAYVAWRLAAPVPDCRGFALWRRKEGADDEPIDTWVAWAGDPDPPSGHHEPSTVWPIQRFMWSDFLVRAGDKVSYRAVPMVGKPGELEPLDDAATPWSDPVEVGPQADPGLSAWFNRGVLATQAMARRLGSSTEPWNRQLTDAIATPGDRIRDYLSGDLRPALLGLLSKAKDDGASIRAALFELDDPELIECLIALGDRAQVVLANGADPEDDNADARATLRKAGVEVHDRLTGHRLAHNKFLVRLDAKGTPDAVWTGSTNWTKTGLCTQVNNAVLLEDKDVAGFYDSQWQELVAAGSEFPKTLVDANGSPSSSPIRAGDDARAKPWFTPVRETVDLADARRRIQAAQEGILFLSFNPGRRGTLIHDAMERASSDGTGLYIHGVLNQDPEAGGDEPAGVRLIRRGQLDEADPDIVLPAAVDPRFTDWDKEIRGYNIVMVHSKVIVCDPFGDHPVVMTGSHNLGTRASGKNDDNLLIIEGARLLAAAYAVNIMAIYNAYRWRYLNSAKAKEKGHDWTGLEDDDSWQDVHFTAPRQHELAFWLGEAGAAG